MKKKGIKGGIKETVIQTLPSDLTIPLLFWEREGWDFWHILIINLESTWQSDLKFLLSVCEKGSAKRSTN